MSAISGNYSSQTHSAFSHGLNFKIFEESVFQEPFLNLLCQPSRAILIRSKAPKLLSQIPNHLPRPLLRRCLPWRLRGKDLFGTLLHRPRRDRPPLGKGRNSPKTNRQSDQRTGLCCGIAIYYQGFGAMSFSCKNLFFTSDVNLAISSVAKVWQSR
jgi:hypothetical protein